MTTERQPGSPGVDLDHLDFLHAEATSGLGSVAGKMKRFENFSFALMNQWGAISAELRTLRARVAELEAEARMWSATAEENEDAIRHLVSIIDRDGGQLQQGDPPVSAAARAGCSVHVLHDRAESAEARIAELEKLFDDAGQGEYNVLALIDHYQSEAMAESEARRAALARVGELECAEADLESQLAAARSEVSRLRETLPLRPVVAWFAQEMERVLQANDHKGGWDTSDIGYLKDRLREECVELEMALDAKPDSEAQREAVDVANFAMMIADSLREEGTLQRAAKAEACWELVEAREELAAAREGKARLDAERTRLVFEGFTYADVFRLREESELEAKVREVLGERFFQVRIGRYREFWLAEWREVVRGETLEHFAKAETLPALLRAILEVEAKGG